MINEDFCLVADRRAASKPQIILESYCECHDLAPASSYVKLDRLSGETDTLVHYNFCPNHPRQLFFGLIIHGYWSTDYDNPRKLIAILNKSERAFHVDSLKLNKTIRDRIVKLSDETWAGVLNDLSIGSSRDILDSSLAREWRRIAGHFRLASKALDHLWFSDDQKRPYECFACPASAEQQAIAPPRNSGDGCFAPTRLNSTQGNLRPVHLEYTTSNLILEQGVVNKYVNETAYLTGATESCNGHKSNSSNYSKSETKKEQCAMYSIICDHAITKVSLFLSGTGERFSHSTLALKSILDKDDWIDKMVFSYDVNCKLSLYLKVRSCQTKPNLEKLHKYF